MENKWLLLRGLGREHAHWLDFPERLRVSSGASEVVCVDLPGTGTEHTRAAPRTIAENSNDVLRRIQQRDDAGRVRWWLLGISLGGMVALDIASRAEVNLAGVVVVNTSSSLCKPHRRLRISAGPRLLLAMATTRVEKRERRVLALTSNRSAGERNSIAEVFANAFLKRPMDRRVVIHQLQAASRFQVPQALAVPLLVLSSRADRLVHHRCSTRIAEYYNAPHFVHPRAGHDLVLDDSDWVCDQLAQWETAVRAHSK